MDVTPQVINEVEFHQKMRGYDPDEVDDFLERIAVGVGQLTDRLHEAEARAATGDRRVIDLERKVRELGDRPAGSADADADADTIKRTLLLAQKTADAAVSEAKEEAQRAMVEARMKADNLITEAEAEARKTSEETRQRMAEEILALEEALDSLKGDHEILERHLDEQRLRLRASIGELQRLVDDPDSLRAESMPELRSATRPSFSDAGDADRTADDDVVIDLSTAAASGDEGRVDDGDAVPVERPITGGVRFSPPEANAGDVEAYGAHGSVATDEAEGDTDAWSRFVREEMLDEPTAAVAMPAPAGDDAYLAELRKAIIDEPADAADSGETRTRFGRRR